MLKVLVVDDRPAVCTALELLFELHGLPALVADDPEQALSLIASEDLGAVVQDMNFRRERPTAKREPAFFGPSRSSIPTCPCC